NRPLNQPSSLFPQPPASRKLSTIEEKKELVNTFQESKLASRLLRTTSTLSRSSSSDGSKESDIKELAASEEEKTDQEDSFVTKQNRRVYNHNIDAFSRILEERDINVLATEQIGEGDGNSESKDTSNNSTCRTNINLSMPTIFTSSEHSSADISSTLLPSLSADLDSDKSIVGDAFSAIKDDHSDVSVSLYPSPVPISNVTPLRNFKDGRISIREERYPSPKTYVTHRSGPMGDLSGGLSPHKRSRFVSPPNRIDRLPVPSIDTSRPERSMSGRMAMEGWPTSPRRMQLASPRFNSLTDLEEGPEGSEQQQESPSLRANPISSQYSSSAVGSNNAGGRASPPIPSKLGLNAIKDLKELKKKITELESQNNKHDILSSGEFSAKSTRIGELQQSDNEMPSSPSLANSQPFETSQPVLSSNKRNFSGVSKPLVHESIGLGIVPEEIQDDKNSKGSSEKRLSGSFTLKLGEIEEESEEPEQQLEQKQPELIKSTSIRKTRTIFSKETHTEESRSESIRKRRLFPSIQSRRTATHILTVKTPLPMLSETEDDEEAESSTTSARQELIRSPSDQSDTSPFPSTPATPSTLLASTTPTSVKSMTSWRWPKRPFSPAREKHKESQSQDNPADHIGKVGNIWAKKTLGQLRKYHQRHSPSILGIKKFGLASPVKESHNTLQSPVSDISDSKKSQTVQVLEDPLETINEEDEDDEIGIWSSEEVDLTEPCTDEKRILSPTSMNVLNKQIIEEVVEEPHGMRVSPEYLTIVGGPSVNAASPNASSASLPLRSNPSSSSLAKHNAKPLFETTFTISNNTNEPLRYEILWPAFRFDVSPAYGVVKAQSVTVVKISVMNKHFVAGARREETKDSRRLMGILKGSEVKDDNKPLMGRTRILVLCENGERKEVVVDIVQVKKKAKGEVETARPSKSVKNSEDGNFIRRSFSQKVDNLIKAARAARTKKNTKVEDKSRSTSNKGKSSANKVTVPISKSASSSNTKKSILSGPTSRSSSPEGSNKYHMRKYPSTTSIRSRPNTPDTYRQIVSPSPGTRSRTPDESKSGKQLPQRKNFIYIGVPGNVNCPTTVIRETNHGVFRIHNPTNKPVTWHLTTATNPFLRRSDTTNSAQKINEEVFLIMKTSGLLRAGQTERVDISFRPIFTGTYYQSFMLEDSISSEGSCGLGGVSVRIQGEGKADVSNPIKADTKKSGSKLMDFEVSESEIQIPATRIGRRRSVGININNPSNQLVRIKCKCEVIRNTSGSISNVSIPLSSVQIKPRASVTLPVRFQPTKVGETRAVVKLQAVGRAEVLVDVVAKGVQDTPIATET
ncbi:11708_t:CDS:2, partial [Gigaspora rosea]